MDTPTDKRYLLSAQLAAGTYLADHFDVIVVGAGHAGCEAAAAAARLGCRTALFTLHIDALANMPCNPSIGGAAKGQLVREIDALGGIMGEIADRHMIQFRMLNRSKGPSVLSPRAQEDRRAYQREMRIYLEQLTKLSLLQSEVASLLWEEGENGRPRMAGILTRQNSIYAAPAVILCPGTFLRGQVIIGDAIYPSGPDGLPSADLLSASLEALGLQLKRFKTGTPPRFQARHIAFQEMQLQPGENPALPFSYRHAEDPEWQPQAQLNCYLTWSGAESRRVIEENLNRSPLYSGRIKGIGPRYCPSFEDKIVKFPEHDRHHIFLEPVGEDSTEWYASGLSSSMPEDVQRALAKTLPGLEKAEFMRFAYAIEYDLIDATELSLDLALRSADGLYMAGQINGSSGYEEAAAQGLLAGINAARWLHGEEPLVLQRSDGYIGVLIDDLVTKGTNEPYRMMTSRAEYRLLLRQDNADERLTPIGRRIGLIDDARWTAFLAKKARIEKELERLRTTRVAPDRLNPFLLAHGETASSGGLSLCELLKRPHLSYADLAELDPERPALAYPAAAEKLTEEQTMPACAVTERPVENSSEESAPGITEDHQKGDPAPFLTPADRLAVEVQIKYEGYIHMELERLERFHKLENRRIPKDLDYAAIRGLKTEARQKLAARRPESIGQASRISGVSPADISILMLAVAGAERKKERPGASNGQAGQTGQADEP